MEHNLENLRIEYPLLVSASFSIHNMYWLGYGAFFTINTLLATAFDLSYADGSTKLPSVCLMVTRFIIPIIGIFISIVAIYTAHLINKTQSAVISRGVEIDAVLHTRMYSLIADQGQSFPWSTAIGSVLFMLIWVGVLYSVAF